MQSLLFNALLCFVFAFSPVQDDTDDSKPAAKNDFPSAKKVINKYVMALGGYEELESRENVFWETKGRNSHGQVFETEAYQSAGRYFCRFTYSDGTGYTRGVWTDGSFDSNGKRAGFTWHQQNGGSLAERQGAELQEYLRRRTFVSSVPTWLENYKSVDCIATEIVHDKKCYQLQLIDHDDTVIDLFFDAETGLLLRRVAVEAFNGTEQKVVRDRYDYMEIAGTKFPKKETISWGEHVYVYDTVAYKVNTKIPKGTFEMPRSIQRQVDAYEKSKNSMKMVVDQDAKPKATFTNSPRSKTKPQESSAKKEPKR